MEPIQDTKSPNAKDRSPLTEDIFDIRKAMWQLYRDAEVEETQHLFHPTLTTYLEGKMANRVAKSETFSVKVFRWDMWRNLHNKLLTAKVTKGQKPEGLQDIFQEPILNTAAFQQVDLKAMTVGELIDFIGYNGEPPFDWPRKSSGNGNPVVAPPRPGPSPFRPLPRRAIKQLRVMTKADRRKIRRATRMQVMQSNWARRTAGLGQATAETATTAVSPNGQAATVMFPCRPGFDLVIEAVWVPAGEEHVASYSLHENTASAPSTSPFAPKVYIGGSLELTEVVPVEIKREDDENDEDAADSPSGYEATASSQAKQEGKDDSSLPGNTHRIRIPDWSSTKEAAPVAREIADAGGSGPMGVAHEKAVPFPTAENSGKGKGKTIPYGQTQEKKATMATTFWGPSMATSSSSSLAMHRQGAGPGVHTTSSKPKARGNKKGKGRAGKAEKTWDDVLVIEVSDDGDYDDDDDDDVVVSGRTTATSTGGAP